MKYYVRRIAAKLAETDVLTYLLPYEARFVARQG